MNRQHRPEPPVGFSSTCVTGGTSSLQGDRCSGKNGCSAHVYGSTYLGRCVMRWKLVAGLLTALVVELHAPPPVDACGVKLTVKSSAPRKAVARTSNPSDVLLLGAPPRRLEMDLTAAGHRVDVAPNAAAA